VACFTSLSFSQLDIRLKQVDVEFMKCLHTKVNLIPVIAKADTMTDDEIAAFKQRVSRSSSFLTKQGPWSLTIPSCPSSADLGGYRIP
jgi:hypothetical protein